MMFNEEMENQRMENRGMEMWFCPTCGKKIQGNARFCTFCGNELAGMHVPMQNRSGEMHGNRYHDVDDRRYERESGRGYDREDGKISGDRRRNRIKLAVIIAAATIAGGTVLAAATPDAGGSKASQLTKTAESAEVSAEANGTTGKKTATQEKTKASANAKKTAEQKKREAAVTSEPEKVVVWRTDTVRTTTVEKPNPTPIPSDPVRMENNTENVDVHVNPIIDFGSSLFGKISNALRPETAEQKQAVAEANTPADGKRMAAEAADAAGDTALVTAAGEAQEETTTVEDLNKMDTAEIEAKEVSDAEQADMLEESRGELTADAAVYEGEAEAGSDEGMEYEDAAEADWDDAYEAEEDSDWEDEYANVEAPDWIDGYANVEVPDWEDGYAIAEDPDWENEYTNAEDPGWDDVYMNAEEPFQDAENSMSDAGADVNEDNATGTFSNRELAEKIKRYYQETTGDTTSRISVEINEGRGGYLHADGTWKEPIDSDNATMNEIAICIRDQDGVDNGGTGTLYLYVIDRNGYGMDQYQGKSFALN